MFLDKSVIDIIEHIAAENPDRTAIESSDGSLTYKQLWQQSDEIAGRLSEEHIALWIFLCQGQE